MESPPELPSLGGSLALSLLSLGLVCLVAFVVLRWLARKGVGVSGAGGPVLRVLARCPLDGRRVIYVIGVGTRAFLIGGAERSLALLAELAPGDLPAAASGTPWAPPAGFAQILARLSGPRDGGAS